MPTDDSQLIFVVDSNSGPAIDYVNSADSTPSTFVTGGPFGTNPSLNNPYQLVADTAAGIYFVIDPNFTLVNTINGVAPAGGTVREGRIGSPESATTVAYTPPAPGFGAVSALAIDTVNHVVYVAEDTLAFNLQNFSAHSGIVKFSYDPTTGAVTGATDVFVRPSGANNQILSLSLDSANRKLYFVDDSEGQFGSSPSITNEVEVLDLNTNTAKVLATLPSGSHFFGSTNDYTKGAIVAVAEDTADHLTFFSTGTDINTPSAQTLNRIYVVDDHTANQTPVQLAELASIDRMDPKFMSFDPVHRQLWVSYIGSINNTPFGFVTRYDVTGTTPGTVALTNPVSFFPNSSQVPQGSFLDVLPTLSTTASKAPGIEQGTAAVLLAAPPGIVDADNDHLAGATVKIAGGTFVSNESSKADDHLGFDAANVTGSVVNGTNITFSYDSASETLTLTGYDTLAHYRTALGEVQYSATGDNPTNYNSNTTRAVVWQVDDGAIGHPSGTNTATTTLTVVGVDDAPTLSIVAATASFTEDGGAVTLANAVSISDPDNLNLVGAAVAIEGGRGVVGDVLAAAGTASIAVSYDSTSETLILTGTDTLAHYQAVLDSVTFNAGENPTNYGSNATRTVAWKLYDGSTVSTVVTTAVNVINVNDPPTLANVPSFAQFDEDSTIFLVPGVSVTDPDSLNLVSATVQITGGTFPGDGDVLEEGLAFPNISASYDSATETLTLTGTDTLLDYQLAIQNIVFHSTSDNPTNFDLNPTRTVTWVVNDGSGSFNLSNMATTTIAITTVNDSPTLSDVAASTSFTESGGAVTLSPAASASDPDNLTLVGATVAITGGGFVGDGDVLAANVAGTSITASYDAATETLVLTGTDTLADYQSVLDTVTFTTASDNPANFGSSPTRTVTWVLDDGASSNDLSTVQTETINIAAVNDPPTLSDVAATALFTERAGAVTLSAAAAVSDLDNLDLVSATIAVAGGAFAGDGDVLAANIAGTNITASYNAATETLTLTGTDTLADYQAVLDSVTFNSISDNPDDFGSNPTRTVTWVVNDGSASSSLSNVATTTIAITSVDDPPTLGNVAASASFTEGGGAVTLSPAASASDPDNLNLAGATVSITGGTFAGDGDVLSVNVAATNITASYDAASETLVLTGTETLANYQQVLDSITFASTSDNPDNFGANPTRTITWLLDDGASSNNLSTARTETINITAVNDPPTLSNVAATAQFTEEAGAVTLSTAAAVSDPDNLDLVSATVAITGGAFAGDGDVLAANLAGTNITASYDSATETLTLTGTDTLADYRAVIDSVTFNSSSDNPTDFGSNPTRTVTWVANDGSGSFNLSDVATTTVAVTDVNDPPTLSNVAASASFTQGGGAVTLSGAASASDPDNLTLAGATVSIVGGTFAGDGDVLAADLAGTSITASYDAASETLVLTGTDTLSNYQQVLDALTFASTSDNPDDYGSNPTRAVTWVLNDGSGSFGLSTTQTETVSITAVNDAPTLTSVIGSASYTENAAPLTVSPNLTISDPDNLDLVNATVSIANGFAGDGNVLAVSTAGTNITASYNATTEALTLAGSDTLAHYQQVFESLTFVTPSDNPTDYGSFPSRVLTWAVNDGSASNNTNAPQFTTIAIAAINDPPTLANVAATVGFLPHHTITISPSIAVSDPDNVTLASATVAITAGSFAGDGDVLAANISGTSITASYNSATETLTLAGVDTLAHYQSVLDSVTFSSGGNPSHGNSNRTRTVNWVVNDGGGSSNLSPAATTISIGGSTARNDFNGDGKSDLLLQKVFDVMVDVLNGTSIASSATTSAPVGQAVEAAADFNGDGKADIVLQSTSGVPNGTPHIWLMNGTSVASTVTLANPGTSWHIIAADDFNGDGNPDLLFQNTNGAVQIWEMNGTSVVTTAVVGNPGSSWRAIGAGDFNGDGNADILFQNNNGTPMIWEMNGTSVVASATLSNPGSQWHAIGTGDFNGDGNADVLFQNNNGAPMIWEMNGTSVAASATLSNPGSQWHAIGTSDFNGDGDADILFQNTNGTPLVWEMNSTSVASTFSLPNPGSGWKLEDDGPIPARQMESGGNSSGGSMRVSAPDGVAGAAVDSGGTREAPFALAGNEALLFPGGSPQPNNQHLTSLSG